MSETISPTDEFRRHYGDRYEAPERSQTAKREYGRLRPWYETLALKGAIREEHAMAARDLDMYWHAVNDATGVCASYGDQRWNGTPPSQLTSYRLLGPEWRETCRQRLKDAKATMDPVQWDILMNCIENNDGCLQAGYRAGAVSKSNAIAKGGRVIRTALHILATHWGYFRPYKDP